LVAGGGAHLSDAAEQIGVFAAALNMPVAHTMTGKGAIACTDRLSAGLFGRYDRIANRYLEQADLVVAVGCKLGEIATKRYTVPPSTVPLIHVDIVAEEFGRTFTPDVALWGDVRESLRDLQQELADDAASIHERQSSYAAELADAMNNWRHSVTERLGSDEVPISMARLLNELNQSLPADAVLIADGGFAAHWSALLFDVKRPGRGFLPDRGFASIGYGLPAAIGASLGASGRPIVSLTGDAGFNMMLGELETARRVGVDATIVIVNNAASGYVKALQHLMYGPGAYDASDLIEMNYADIATAMGCRGIRVEDPSSIAPALAEGLSGTGVTVVDVVVTRDPAQMLPGVDSRTVSVTPGDRIA
jgi:acetolactate synthase-1/2/3 large subunit